MLHSMQFPIGQHWTFFKYVYNQQDRGNKDKTKTRQSVAKPMGGTSTHAKQKIKRVKPETRYEPGTVRPRIVTVRPRTARTKNTTGLSPHALQGQEKKEE